MKRIGGIIRTIVLALFVIFMSGCHKYEQIQILYGKVESLNMSGLRSVDVTLDVGLSNPAGKIIVEEAVGTLKHFGKVIGNVTLAPLTLDARTSASYKVEARVELAKSMSIMEIMRFADIRRLNECTVDVSLRGKASGIRLKREYNDIPLKKLLEKAKNEKV